MGRVGRIWDGYIKGREGYIVLGVVRTYNFLGKFCRAIKKKHQHLNSGCQYRRQRRSSQGYCLWK